MPVLDTPSSAKEEVENRLPSPGPTTDGNAASSTIHRFVETVDRVAPLDAVSPAGKLELIAGAVEMAQRLAHAPFDLGRALVNSVVLVDVDVDVDIASKQCVTQESDQEGMR